MEAKHTEDAPLAGTDLKPITNQHAHCREPMTELLETLKNTPLEPTDLYGRHKLSQSDFYRHVRSLKTVAARIVKNHFKFKSLSCWSYNFGRGCLHGCLFCFVPSSQQSSNPKDPAKKGGPLNQALHAFGVDDPDLQWGEYVSLLPFDEDVFRASLRAADSAKPSDRDSKGRLILNPDGNRAVIFCSTTDPFQVIKNANPEKQKLLNALRKKHIIRALEIIRDESTINVRILTRSAPSPDEWAVIKSLGNRVLFGVSLPTLNESLRKVYEPNAPGCQSRLRTLAKAKDLGIPLFVAVAPTYPECDEADLRNTLSTIKQFDPITIFHEPINIRAKNRERIQKHADDLGVKLRTEVFQTGLTWRAYAIEQLQAVEKIATELGLKERLHLWPDADLGSKAQFLRMREMQFVARKADREESIAEKRARRVADAKYFDEKFLPWIERYWHRISEWPGKRQ
jgi:DNA repair photolyase